MPVGVLTDYIRCEFDVSGNDTHNNWTVISSVGVHWSGVALSSWDTQLLNYPVQQFEEQIVAGSYELGFISGGNPYVGSFSYNVVIEVYSSLGTPTVVPSVTPVVTMTPVVGGSYCSSVSQTEDGFSWDGIEYGDTVCFDLGGPAFEDNGSGWWDWFVHDLWTAFGTPNIPWIAHICMQDVSFGVVQIFGVYISLELILYVVGIITLIRNMFVS